MSRSTRESISASLDSRRITPAGGEKRRHWRHRAAAMCLLVRDGTLFAQAIDPTDHGATGGDAVRVADGVGYTLGTIGYSPVSAADTTLAYGPGVRLDDRFAMARSRRNAGRYRSSRAALCAPRAWRPMDAGWPLTMIEDRAARAPISGSSISSRGTFTRVTSRCGHRLVPGRGPIGATACLFGSARMRATTVFEKDLSSSCGARTSVIPIEVAHYPVDSTAGRSESSFRPGRATAMISAFINRAQRYPSPAPIDCHAVQRSPGPRVARTTAGSPMRPTSPAASRSTYAASRRPTGNGPSHHPAACNPSGGATAGNCSTSRAIAS